MLVRTKGIEANADPGKAALPAEQRPPVQVRTHTEEATKLRVPVRI